MDRLGDLSRFDGHTPGPWNNECDFPLMENRDIHATEWSHEPNRRLALSAPDLLAELKEARKKIEELQAFIWLAKQHGSDALISVENDTDGPGCCQGIANMLAALEGWDGKE